MIKRVVGMHFSPNGGTATITEQIISELADRISAECKSDVVYETYDLLRRPLDLPTFDQETIVVVAVPTIVGKMPLPALRVIEKLNGSGAFTIAVVSYGTKSYGNALYELYRRAEERGFKVVGAGAFVTEHLGITDIVLNRPNTEDIREIRRFAEAAALKIKRLAGCEIDGLKVEPAPMYIDGRLPIHRISKISPRAAAIAESAFEKVYKARNRGEWYL